MNNKRLSEIEAAFQKFGIKSQKNANKSDDVETLGVEVNLPQSDASSCVSQLSPLSSLTSDSKDSSSSEQPQSALQPVEESAYATLYFCVLCSLSAVLLFFF